MATRWGIISAGMISHDFVNALSTYGENSDHKVVAVAARSLDSAKTFADKHGIPKAYGDYESIAKDADVEIVYIGSINTTHLDLCKMMLNSGKHVLCEKPLAMNVKECKELFELAKSKKLFFMEALWARFLPSYVRLREEIEKKTIGDVIAVNVQFGEIIKSERVAKLELGGGSVLDIGIYCVHFACLVFGGEKPEKILAGGHLNEHGVDESVSVTLLYSGGRTATLATHTKVQMDNVAMAYGIKGSIRLSPPFWCTSALTTPEGKFEFPYPEAKLPFFYKNSAGLRYQAQHARECIEKGLTESPVMSFEDSLLLAEILEQIRKQVGVVYPQDN